eukprot:comp17891_c0_seq1/m.18129 comp17891_c0_seq1/g.18129  ORF comp17891_c0_seq1/g.18129 comp17891_c0_seq1/m.18129 type:complete len:116 (-) comp17891_c0_seq1:575-922(-)
MADKDFEKKSLVELDHLRKAVLLEKKFTEMDNVTPETEELEHLTKAYHIQQEWSKKYELPEEELEHLTQAYHIYENLKENNRGFNEHEIKKVAHAMKVCEDLVRKQEAAVAAGSV